VFLNQGIIAEEGDPRDVLLNPQTERLRAFLAAQAA
jgi:ABC-type histidine transport system ATPase subunit